MQRPSQADMSGPLENVIRTGLFIQFQLSQHKTLTVRRHCKKQRSKNYRHWSPYGTPYLPIQGSIGDYILYTVPNY